MEQESQSKKVGNLPEVALYGLSKNYGGVAAVDNVTLEVDRGEFVALLGPSGCGKSTTLRVIAGFISPNAGSVVIRGRDITQSPPHRRNLAMVFQSYALFPHLTVADNVAFGLRMRKLRASEIPDRVDRALSLVKLADLGQRYPRQLSGGQQQRVALARALVVEPDVLLLDEPLSNLDAKLREEMRVEIRDLAKQSGATTIYVTHDQSEALSMADRVVVMSGGRIAQVGTPEDVYERPADLFVATFIGDANVIPAVVDCVASEDYQLVIGEALKCRIAGQANLAKAGETVWLMVRPERVLIGPPACGEGIGQADFMAPGRLVDLTYLGATARYTVELLGGLVIRAHLPAGGFNLQPGETVTVGWERRYARLLPSASR